MMSNPATRPREVAYLGHFYLSSVENMLQAIWVSLSSFFLKEHSQKYNLWTKGPAQLMSSHLLEMAVQFALQAMEHAQTGSCPSSHSILLWATSSLRKLGNVKPLPIPLHS